MFARTASLSALGSLWVRLGPDLVAQRPAEIESPARRRPRTSNALELSSKHSNAWRDLPACLRNNECEAERALAAGWRVLDSYGVTATPPKLRRQGLALHASADERPLGAAATRAVLSSVLAALAR